MSEHREYFECECATREHLMVVERDDEWGVTVFVQARPMTFWQRVRFAIFGRPPTWFYATLLRKEDLVRFKNILIEQELRSTSYQPLSEGNQDR